MVVVGERLNDISNVKQLEGRRVITFPEGGKILGIESFVSTFASFQQRSRRFDQIRPLLAGRADVLLADGLITAHFLNLLRDRAKLGQEPDVDPNKIVRFRKLFSRGPQRLYFREKQVADDFDRCADELNASGETEALTKPYVDKYRDILGDQYPYR